MIPNAVTTVPDTKIQEFWKLHVSNWKFWSQLHLDQDCGLPRRARIRCRGQGWEGADAEILVEK